MEKPIRRIGPKDVPLPQEASLLALPPGIVIDGLSNTISSKIVTKMDAAATVDGEEALVDLGHAQMLSSIGHLVDGVAHPDLLSAGPAYKHTVRRTLRYMRFVGFESDELSVESIQRQAQSRTGVPGSDNISYFPTKNSFKVTPELIAEQEARERELVEERGYSDEAYRRATYAVLDRLMETYDILPKFDLETEEQIEEEAARIQEEMISQGKHV
jgi:hypothetical protein